jgi:hypothetical protein
MNIANFVEQISDDFQSTFTVVGPNKLANMLGMPGDFEALTLIIQKYIPDANVKFTKSNQMPGEYDIYIVEVVS